MAFKKKLLGKISEEEKVEIKNLFFRKKSLEELFQVLLTSELDVKNKEVYDRMMEDYTSVSQKFSDWWKIKSALHNWESVEGGNWDIDFDKNDVYLNYPSDDNT
jgi:CXXX repeat modification system protein